ncbi:MAG: nitroreductase/quinone reductase family protein [Chloroflexota bacterium]
MQALSIEANPVCKDEVVTPLALEVLPMWRKLLNPFMIWLLRSPLHFFASEHTMLISFRGRKSGKVYTTPVDYGRNNGAVYAITSLKYAWWKNLSGGADVELVIKGNRVAGQAQITDDSQSVLDTLQKMYPNRTGFERIASGCIALHINLAVV